MASKQTTKPTTLWDRFLGSMLNPLLDQEAMNRQFERIDWPTECDRLSTPGLVYPEYYQSQNFHGVTGGYLSPGAAVSYDPITQYVLPPNEDWVRQGVVEAVRSQPRRILDLGCGTGSTTLLLKRTFPEAQVVGLDLSPYMLVMAQHKATGEGLKVDWRQGKAEETGFEDNSFDLISLSLLFHETPPAVSQAILGECFRLLPVGGEVVVLDGNQDSLRQTPWLLEVFEEPYIAEYAQGDVADWMEQAGFASVETRTHWWIHQVTRGVKPLPGQDSIRDEFPREGDMAFA
ncbi:class I SAM-dependent methyltransferase [Sodalinema gerasimenkoae]|uniref:class I SAM-dependent methyltransferase n=1 Tax=Sodalinema gerasimenkoae TaxID=2862348 RepID=UPI00135C9037|nr:class I SAM-dependent methyltransferase [Sodalinema gerasimenkoae]